MGKRKMVIQLWVETEFLFDSAHLIADAQLDNSIVDAESDRILIEVSYDNQDIEQMQAVIELQQLSGDFSDDEEDDDE